jgi:hypothetical protein
MFGGFVTLAQHYFNAGLLAGTIYQPTMAEQVQQLLPELKRLQRMTPIKRKQHIQKCSKKFILEMCTCVKNLLKGYVPLKSAHLTCLKRYKSH